MLTSYQAAEKLIGVAPESVIKLPQGDAITQDQMNAAVYDRLGRPKAAADYKIQVPEGVDKAFADNVASWFHEQGLNTKQAAAINGKWNDFVKNAQTAAATAQQGEFKKQVDSLKVEFGQAYDDKIKLVDRVAEAFSISPEHLSAIRNAMGPAASIKLLAEIGSKLAVDDTFLGDGQKPGFQSALSPAEAKAEIAGLMKDTGFLEKIQKKDVDATARWTRLHQYAHPGTMTFGG